MAPVMCWLLALSAQLAEPPVYVVALPFVVGGPELGARDVEQAVAHAGASRRGIRILPLPDLAGLSADAGRRLSDCGPEAACLAAVLGETTVPLALLVVVNTQVRPPVVAVRAIAAGRDGQARGEVAHAVASDDRDVLASVEAASAEVLDALGYLEWARISLGEAPPEAALRVVAPSNAIVESMRAARVPPGAVSVVVEAPDYAPQSFELRVDPGEARRLDADLDRSGGWWRSPWFWGAVGVAVAAGAVSTTFALTGGSTERCVCIGHPAARCACP